MPCMDGKHEQLFNWLSQPLESVHPNNLTWIHMHHLLDYAFSATIINTCVPHCRVPLCLAYYSCAWQITRVLADYPCAWQIISATLINTCGTPLLLESNIFSINHLFLEICGHHHSYYDIHKCQTRRKQGL